MNHVATLGWGPRARQRAGYRTPDQHYEATVARLVTPGCRWLDVGGGRDTFPHNRPLAADLAARASHLVAVDPDATVHQHPLATEKVQAFMESLDALMAEPFDVVTLRMVAEHIEKPAEAVASLARLTRPGGHVVVYTVNKFSPLALAAWLTPTWVHHAVKSRLWHTAEEDTFPVAYRMNTRGTLRTLFSTVGLREAHFAYLDDCRTFHKFKVLHYAELLLWSALRSVGWHYPETCLLGVYRRS